MNVSFDLHGVIDKDPKLFSEMMGELYDDGHTVYVLTDSTFENAIAELAKLRTKFVFKCILSTTDYLMKQNDNWEYDQHGRPSWHPDIWWAAKAQICKDYKIDVHYDNCEEYALRSGEETVILYDGDFRVTI